LLDEPLSNLDAQLREQMRVELKRLQQETGVTAVYVTHDQAEALAISDRIAVMNEGRIAQIGAPKEIYSRPASEFVANFIGRTNLLHGTLTRDAAPESVVPVTTDMGEVLCFFPHGGAANTNISLVVRPEHIAIHKVNGVEPRECATNRLAGHVMREIYLGEIIEYLVQVGGGEILVRTPLGSVSKGDAVILSFAAEHTVALAQT
jgi:ABC-type Fe3+/spermidine/putrescine transport system ATPase subunit